MARKRRVRVRLANIVPRKRISKAYESIRDYKVTLESKVRREEM